MVRVTDMISEISAKMSTQMIFDFRAARIDEVTWCSKGSEGG